MPIFGYVALLSGAIILAMGIALKVQSGRLDTAQKNLAATKLEYAGFQIEVKRIGEAAEAKRKDVEAKDKQAKEKADEENKRAAVTQRAAIARLRSELDSTRGSFLSAATSCPAGSTGASGYRAEFERAYRTLVEELRAVGDQGTKNTLGLNTAKAWAAQRNAQ